MTLTITAWNIMQGGGKRVDAIIAGLESLDTDVAILGEWRATSPNRLSERLAHAGFEHAIERPDPSGGYGALLIASRVPLNDTPCPTYLDAAHGHRFIPFVAGGIVIGAAHIPDHDRTDRKRDFWRFLLDEWEPFVRSTPVLLVGDFNTGLHYRDELGATFECSEIMAGFETAGWRDAWIERNRRSRPPATWYSPGWQNPFRLDHALLSPVAPKPKRVDYPTSVNGRTILDTPRLSDHLPLTLQL